jgi:TonB family protein
MIRTAFVFVLSYMAVAYGQDSPKPSPQTLTLRPFTKPDFSSCGTSDPDKKIYVYVQMDVNTKGVPEGVSVSRSSGNACVDKIALASAKNLRYLPPTRDGKPVDVHTAVKADF